MSKMIKRVNSRIEICEADKYDQERGNMWVLRFPSDQGAWLSRALSVEDMQQLRAALDDSRFLPQADDDGIVWKRQAYEVPGMASPVLRYVTHAAGAAYRIERETSRAWNIWERPRGKEQFVLWDVQPSLAAAQAEVARIVGREVAK